jgi:hypothetical protein
MNTSFRNIETKIYKQHQHNYLPTKIKYLFVAESPPAFEGESPKAYFYFPEVPKADILFYTLIKAIYDLDFIKYVDSRTEILKRFQSDGYYLVDAVPYPINKTKVWEDVPNSKRQEIILANKNLFEASIKELISSNKIDSTTQTILIKETVYNVYFESKLLRVINDDVIKFPRYIKDRSTIEKIQKLIKT